MQDEVKIFEGHEVEVLELEGLVLFNPYHVGECLELSDSAVRNYLAKMNEKQAVILKNSDVRDKDIRKLNNAGEKFITESGVYKLVFKSHKPNAEKFTDWIADEVLPSIRKNGGYIANQEKLGAEQTLANALLLAQNIIAGKDKQIAEMQTIIQQSKGIRDIPKPTEICKRSNQPQVCVKEQAMEMLARILAKQLDCSQNEAIGLIVRFWMWTVKNMDVDGNIQMAEREDIEEALVHGQCGTYSGSEAVEAFNDVGLIDGADMLYAADWSYWQDIVLKDMKRKATDRMRQRAYREQKKLIK